MTGRKFTISLPEELDRTVRIAASAAGSSVSDAWVVRVLADAGAGEHRAADVVDALVVVTATQLTAPVVTSDPDPPPRS